MLQYAIKEDVNIYMHNSYMYMLVMARLISKVSLTRGVFAIIETIHLATLKCNIN